MRGFWSVHIELYPILVPSSDRNSRIVPRRLINILSALMNKSVSIVLSVSRCTARKYKHVKINSYYFKVFRPFLMCHGQKTSMRVYVLGAVGVKRSSGLSNIWMSVIPRNVRHVTHFDMKCVTTVCPFIIHKPDCRISFRVIPRPWWWSISSWKWRVMKLVTSLYCSWEWSLDAWLRMVRRHVVDGRHLEVVLRSRWMDLVCRENLFAWCSGSWHKHL